MLDVGLSLIPKNLLLLKVDNIKKPPVLPSGSLTNHNIHLKPFIQPFLSYVPYQVIIAPSYTSGAPQR